MEENGYKPNSIHSNLKVFNVLHDLLPKEGLRQDNLPEIYQNLLKHCQSKQFSPSYLASFLNVFKLYLRLVCNIPVPQYMDWIPKREDSKPVFLELSEIEFLLNEVQDSRNRLMILLLFGAGIRTGELRLLKRKNFDLKRRHLEVMDRKEKHDRYVPLGAKLVQHVQQYLKEVNPMIYLFEGRQEGQPVTERSVQCILSKVGREAELSQNLNAGILRNSFAVHLLRRGGSLEYVSYLLGHKNLSTTRKYLPLVPMFKPSCPLDAMTF